MHSRLAVCFFLACCTLSAQEPGANRWTKDTTFVGIESRTTCGGFNEFAQKQRWTVEIRNTYEKEVDVSWTSGNGTPEVVKRLGPGQTVNTTVFASVECNSPFPIRVTDVANAPKLVSDPPAMEAVPAPAAPMPASKSACPDWSAEMEDLLQQSPADHEPGFLRLLKDRGVMNGPQTIGLENWRNWLEKDIDAVARAYQSATDARLRQYFSWRVSWEKAYKGLLDCRAKEQRPSLALSRGEISRVLAGVWVANNLGVVPFAEVSTNQTLSFSGEGRVVYESQNIDGSNRVNTRVGAGSFTLSDTADMSFSYDFVFPPRNERSARSAIFRLSDDELVLDEVAFRRISKTIDESGLAAKLLRLSNGDAGVLPWEGVWDLTSKAGLLQALLYNDGGRINGWVNEYISYPIQEGRVQNGILRFCYVYGQIAGRPVTSEVAAMVSGGRLALVQSLTQQMTDGSSKYTERFRLGTKTSGATIAEGPSRAKLPTLPTLWVGDYKKLRPEACDKCNSKEFVKGTQAAWESHFDKALELFEQERSAKGENCRQSADIAIANERLGRHSEAERIAISCLQSPEFQDLSARGVYYQLLGLNDFALAAYMQEFESFPEGNAYVHAENLLRELGRPAEAERIEVAHAAQMKAEKGPSAWSMLLEGISEGLAQGPGIGRRNPTPTAPTPSAPQQPKQEVASTGSPAQSCTGWHNESSPHDVPYPPPCIPCNLPANGQGRPTATWDPILKKCVNSH